MPNNTPPPVSEIWSTIQTFITSPISIAIICYIAGFGSAYVKHWVQWIFKKKELALTNQFNSRKESIQRWREDIGKYNDFNSFSKTSTFYDLRHHFPDDDINYFRGWKDLGLDIEPKSQRWIGPFNILVSKLEKEWGI